MKLLGLISSILLPLALQAQSKKEINAQLWNTLNSKKATYDSINKKVAEINAAFLWKHLVLDDIKSQFVGLPLKELEMIRRIETERKRLKDLGGDPELVVSSGLLENTQAPKLDFGFPEYADLIIQRFEEIRLDTSLADIRELRVKNQNILLMSKIQSFDSLNTIGIQRLIEGQEKRELLIQRDVEVTNYFNDYRNYLSELRNFENQYSRAYFKLREEKEKAFLLEETKRQEELEKKKNKNKKARFVPPVIIDRPIYDYEEVVVQEEVNTKSNEDYSYIVPEPEPGPEPEPKPLPEIYDVVDENAEFPGGSSALTAYLQKNLRMPESAIDNKINGKCFVRFVIAESGNVSNVRVIRGVTDCPDCDQEAIRVVKAMPDWIPGKNQGKPVNMWYNLPIKFTSN